MNNFLTLLLPFLYESLSLNSCLWSAPNHFCFGTALFEQIFVQPLKVLIRLSVSFKSRKHGQGKILKEGHCIQHISLSCITQGWSWIWSVTQEQKGFRAGLIFTKESYHLLLELSGVNHTRNVFEVVCSLKKKIKTRRNHRSRAFQITSVYLGRLSLLCWQRFHFFSLELIPLKPELASSDVQ